MRSQPDCSPTARSRPPPKRRRCDGQMPKLAEITCRKSDGVSISYASHASADRSAIKIFLHWHISIHGLFVVPVPVMIPIHRPVTGGPELTNF